MEKKAIRILMVVNDFGIRDYIKSQSMDYLANYNNLKIRIDKASYTPEAIQLLKENKYDIIVLGNVGEKDLVTILGGGDEFDELSQHITSLNGEAHIFSSLSLYHKWFTELSKYDLN